MSPPASFFAHICIYQSDYVMAIMHEMHEIHYTYMCIMEYQTYDKYIFHVHIGAKEKIVEFSKIGCDGTIPDMDIYSYNMKRAATDTQTDRPIIFPHGNAFFTRWIPYFLWRYT